MTAAAIWIEEDEDYQATDLLLSVVGDEEADVA